MPCLNCFHGLTGFDGRSRQQGLEIEYLGNEDSIAFAPDQRIYATVFHFDRRFEALDETTLERV